MLVASKPPTSPQMMLSFKTDRHSILRITNQARYKGAGTCNQHVIQIHLCLNTYFYTYKYMHIYIYMYVCFFVPFLQFIRSSGTTLRSCFSFMFHGLRKWPCYARTWSRVVPVAALRDAPSIQKFGECEVEKKTTTFGGVRRQKKLNIQYIYLHLHI